MRRVFYTKFLPTEYLRFPYKSKYWQPQADMGIQTSAEGQLEGFQQPAECSLPDNYTDVKGMYTEHQVGNPHCNAQFHFSSKRNFQCQAEDSVVCEILKNATCRVVTTTAL